MPPFEGELAVKLTTPDGREYTQMIRLAPEIFYEPGVLSRVLSHELAHAGRLLLRHIGGGLPATRPPPPTDAARSSDVRRPEPEPFGAGMLFPQVAKDADKPKSHIRNGGRPAGPGVLAVQKANFARISDPDKEPPGVTAFAKLNREEQADLIKTLGYNPATGEEVEAQESRTAAYLAQIDDLFDVKEP